MTDHHDEDESAFARTGMVSPVGPLIDPLKTWVDPDTGAAFRRLCNEAGTDVSGAARDWIYMLVHGKTFTDICNDAAKVKREKLFGTGPIAGLLKAKS